VDRSRVALRRRALQAPLDWAAAVLLCGAGLADLLGTRFAHPLGPALLATMLTFLPLGLRRRHPVAVLAVVAGASLVLELGLGDPANGKQYSFEVFLAWLLAAYSAGAYTDGRRHRLAAMVGLAAAAVWVIGSYAAGANDQNTVPSVFFAAVAWAAGRAMRRRQQLVELLDERARQLEHEREERIRATVADERARIARELHDVVAHSVSVMVVQAQAGPRLVGEHERAVAAFDAIAASGREALGELRRLLGILRTADEALAIGPQPGLGSLAALVDQLGEAGLAVDLRIEGEQIALAPGVDLAAYRIVQEALTNTLRHAGPAHAGVVVRYGPAAVEFEIVDDGAGVAGARNGSGHGLVGMRERTALYGGRLEAGPRPDGGFAVRASLPLAGATR
jgi:signal transduction histidine kinase